MRRLGMVYAANNSLQVMENDTTTKKVMDAYTAGVNTYIDQLTASYAPRIPPAQLPARTLEQPENSASSWKYMSFDLYRLRK